MRPKAPKLDWYICRVFRARTGGLMLISLGLFEEGNVLTTRNGETKYGLYA